MPARSRVVALAIGLTALPFTGVAAPGSGQDYTGYVTNEIDSLITVSLPAIQSLATTLLTSIAIIMLVIHGIRWMTASASHHHRSLPLGDLMNFAALFLIAEMLLRYYDSPLGIIGGVSVHQAIPRMAQDVAGRISLGTLGTLLTAIKAITDNMQKPSMFDPLELFTFASVSIDLWVIRALLFVITIIGFIAVGIGGLLGPLFIPWLLVPRLNWLFWNWVSFILEYSFYTVLADALVFIWANVLVTFYGRVFHGDYTLAHLLTLLPALFALTAGMVYSGFKITQFVHDLFKGTASAGAGFSSAVGAAVKGAFA